MIQAIVATRTLSRDAAGILRPQPIVLVLKSKAGNQKYSPSLNQMNRHGNDRSQRSTWRKGPPSFARWNKPQRALLLLLVFAGNILVASVAWIIVRLVTG
jgi:hypothetical protein